MTLDISIRLATAFIAVVNGGHTHSYKISVRTYWKAARLLTLFIRREKVDSSYCIQILSDLLLQNQQAVPNHKIRNMLKLYSYWPNIESLPTQLSWTHFVCLMKLADPGERLFYQNQAVRLHWSARELGRQIKSRYYQRTLQAEADWPFKKHYVLEFTELEMDWREINLEDQLLKKIQTTLLEMGAGFSFVNRQQRIATPAGSLFYIDLVLFNRQLNAHVLIDLKRGPLTHRDIGQMDVYLRLFNRLVVNMGQAPAYGLILCASSDPSLLEYSALKDNPQLKMATYSLEFPNG